MDLSEEDMKVVGVRLEDAAERMGWETLILCGDSQLKKFFTL